MSVLIHFANGFEEIEALTVVDVLRRADIDAKMVSITGDFLVTGAHGVTVKTDQLFDGIDYGSCEMIVLPGGMPGSKNLGAHEELTEKIVEFAAKGKWIAAICAAPMVFGELGLLEGKTAVIYPGMESHLYGAKVGDKNVEVDGKIITSKGPGTAMQFSLALVEALMGKETAKNLAVSLLVSY